MALTPLAAVADLPSAWQSHPDASRALLVASAAIRDAAGSAISEQTVTVTLNAPKGTLLSLPSPVTEVTAVTVDGIALNEDDYEVLSNGLWRHCGWGYAPVPVSVTFTFGLAAVPDDVADLACQLAASWLSHNDLGGGSTAGLLSARIDDAAETYSDESAGQVSPVYLPEITRNWLAARFGGGVHVVETL